MSAIESLTLPEPRAPQHPRLMNIIRAINRRLPNKDRVAIPLMQTSITYQEFISHIQQLREEVRDLLETKSPKIYQQLHDGNLSVHQIYARINSIRGFTMDHVVATVLIAIDITISRKLHHQAARSTDRFGMVDDLPDYSEEREIEELERFLHGHQYD